MEIAKGSSNDEETLKNLGESATDVSTALDSLLDLLKDDGQQTMNTILEEIVKSSDLVISSQSLQEMIAQVKNLSTASSQLIQVIKKEADNQEDADFQVIYIYIMYLTLNTVNYDSRICFLNLLIA